MRSRHPWAGFELVFALVFALLFALLAAGCGKGAEPTDKPAAAAAATSGAPGAGTSGPAGGSDAPRKAVSIAVVTHGQASDPFWSVVKNGIDRAAKDMGATVPYNAPQTFDMVAMSRLIAAAVAKKPDGLVVSIPDPSALSKSIKAAVAAGIPVMSINSGSDAYKELGVMLHVGQTEYEAGYGGGEQMAKANVKSALCVNHEVGNSALDLRCKGFGDAIAKAGGASKVLAVTASDPTDSQQKITAALAGEVDGILTIGPLGSKAALGALKQAGKVGKVRLGTFDLTPEVLKAVKDGEMEFAIDQQQYLQGYLPVTFLALNAKYGLIPGGNVPSGPNLITKEKAAQVVDLSAKGIR